MNVITRGRCVWLVPVVLCAMILTFSCISTQAFALETDSSTIKAATAQMDKSQSAATVDVENDTFGEPTSVAEEQNTVSPMTSALIDPQYVKIYRLYNQVSKEHLYTRDANEKAFLSALSDWAYEGVGWYAPSEGAEVLRAYNPVSGEHIYTMDLNEVTTLVTQYGWTNEGVAFYSGSSSMTKVARFFNPNAGIGAHHYSTDSNEISILGKRGWKGEGTAWYTAVNQECTDAFHLANALLESHYSKDGLYDRLTSDEGFSEEVAQFAVDYVEVDWKQSAALKARDYSTVLCMPPSEVYDQLLDDKFTEEEARYGVEHM